MADPALEALQALLGQQAGLESFTKSIGELDKAMADAMARGDTKAILALEKLKKATENLSKAKEEKLAIDQMVAKATKEGTNLTEEQIKTIKKHDVAVARNEKIITGALKARTDARKAETAEIAKANAALKENWLQNSKLGKVYGFATGEIGKLIGGLTAMGLVYKALSQHAKSAEIRQEILIQQFRGFRDAATGASESIWEGVGANLAMNEALKETEKAAHRMGVSVETIGPAMVEFARMTGEKSPKALGNLTKAAITVSRTLGISMPEAVDFIQTRMDKFGGTASSAVMALENIRKEAQGVNDMFGRTVVRGDDVAKILQEISRQTQIYAIDQRVVSGVLRDNIARLQATGDSYDLARRKADAYTKAITGEAPKWMKVLAGEDIVSEMEKSFVGDEAEDRIDNFMKQFGASLDAGAPGLGKKVGEILEQMKAGEIGRYSGALLIQELTSATTVGMNAMNKQILKLANDPQGIALIAEHFTKTKAEARGMVVQAKKWEEQQDKVALLAGETPKQLAKSLGITKKMSEALFKDAKGYDKKQKILEIIRQTEMAALKIVEEKRKLEAEAKGKEAAARAKETITTILLPQLGKQKKALEDANASFNASAKKVAGLTKAKQAADATKDAAKIALAKKQLDEAVAGHKNNKDALAKAQLSYSKTEVSIDAMKEKVQQQLDQNAAKAAQDMSMEEIAQRHMDTFLSLSANSGKIFKELLANFGTVATMAAGIPALLGGRFLFKWLVGKLSRTFADGMEDAKIPTLLREIRDSGGGGGGGGEGRGRGKKGRRNRIGRGSRGRDKGRGIKKQRGGGSRAGWGGAGREDPRGRRDKEGRLGEKEQKRQQGYKERLEAKYGKKGSEERKIKDKIKTKPKPIPEPKRRRRRIGGFKTAALLTGLTLLSSFMPDIAEAATSLGGGDDEEKPTPEPVTPAPVPTAAPEKKKEEKGFFDSAMESGSNLLKGATEAISSDTGSMITGLAASLTGPIGKLGKGLFALPAAMAAMQAGSWKEALAELAPTIGAIGGGVLGSVLGPLGSIGGGMAGGEGGELVKEWLLASAAKDKAEAAAKKKKEGGAKEGVSKKDTDKVVEASTTSAVAVSTAIAATSTKSTGILAQKFEDVNKKSSTLLKGVVESSGKSTVIAIEKLKPKTDKEAKLATQGEVKEGIASKLDPTTVAVGTAMAAAAAGTALAATSETATALTPITGPVIDADAKPGETPTTKAGGTADAGGGGMTGSLVGQPQQDGSIMLKIDNFIPAMASAQGMMKNGIRQSSG